MSAATSLPHFSFHIYRYLCVFLLKKYDEIFNMLYFYMEAACSASCACEPVYAAATLFSFMEVVATAGTSAPMRLVMAAGGRLSDNRKNTGKKRENEH